MIETDDLRRDAVYALAIVALALLEGREPDLPMLRAARDLTKVIGVDTVKAHISEVLSPYRR